MPDLQGTFMQRNIYLLYIIKASKWFMLYMPVIKLYYAENHLEDHHLLLLHGVYSFIIAITEIPSGYFADVLGRKITMISGTLLGTMGFAVYAFTGGLWAFLVAEILLGFGQSFISGSDTALLYDSLLDLKKQKKYIRYEGKITAIGNFSEALAGITVSVLAFQLMREYYYIQIGIAFTGFAASVFLIEPSHHRMKKYRRYKQVFQLVKKQIRSNRLLMQYILFSSVIGFASLSMAWFAQMIFYELDIRTSFFYGIAWTVLNLTVGFGSLMAYRTEALLGRKISLLFIFIALGSSFIVISFAIAKWVIIVLLFFYLIRGIAHPVLKLYINELTASDVRATIFSVRSLFIRILFSIAVLFLGPARKFCSLELSIFIAGCILIIPGCILLYLLLKKKA